ncbi:MAG: Mur ligase family protein, partial [Candidatus Omnitrophica bacterium]|nr:Mur ligase family protein [Candidatus Omnitrophota bacterium]
LEIGTNHFGEAGYLAGICEPNIGIITNIGPSHLEHFGTIAGVLREKYNVVKGLKNPRICILNSDDGLLKSKIAAKGGKTFVLSFGINNGGDFSASDIISLRGSHSFYVNKKYKFTLNTPGYYNIYNALAAITAGRVFGIPHKHIASRLKTFDFPQGRLKIRVLRGIRFIDDTYNSNPLSLEQALDAFTRIPVKGKKVFVMGDMLELGRDSQKFHYEAGRRAAQCCDVFITVGPLSRMAAKAAEDAYFDRGRIFSCDTSDNARDIIFSRLSLGKGDFVLVKGSRSMKMENIFPGK